MEYPNDFINKFICGDAVEVMKQIPDGSVDVVVTSPPYNLRSSQASRRDGSKRKHSNWGASSLLFDGGYDDFDDNMPHDEYVEWQRACITEMLRVTSETGAVFYNHKWRVQKGLMEDRQDIMDGFPVRQIIIWHRAGGHNHNVTFFTPHYEVIYFIPKPKFRITYGRGASYGTVWSIPQVKNPNHPASFPLEIPFRCVDSTAGAKVVLDPFMGSGTTALAAKRLGLDFIGIDRSQAYCDIAARRLKEEL